MSPPKVKQKQKSVRLASAWGVLNTLVFPGEFSDLGGDRVGREGRLEEPQVQLVFVGIRRGEREGGKSEKEGEKRRRERVNFHANHRNK